ncbi:hypothetical protein LV457_13840 [Mycobacterium sp. MYCO198283]|uniref:hypothetical protein n=1 Tax=Mycobacterium sp. MYCO198283 TaxID=2883505 RepID=UPI001E42ABEF|nr:hypothetical protein [Mycobacterium sp. MYCO198283]MCG5433359.1 hypothetical protein [Mycobacterium sp. MYCO198283]
MPKSTIVRMRVFATAVAVALSAAGVAACGEASQIVTTGDSPQPTASSTATSDAAPAVDPGALANAFDYYVRQNGRSGYYFTAPSGRWRCAIEPRTRVACQASAGSAIPVAGAPDSVVGPDGTDIAPNTIALAEEGDARFEWSDPATFIAGPPPKPLPFGKILAIAGFRCHISEAVGISCRSERSGNGFTFSADGYTLQYTASPRG